MDKNVLNNSLAAPTNRSITEIFKKLWTSDYAVSKSRSTGFEDSIYAKSRVFFSDGSLPDSDVHIGNNTNYVSAKAVNTKLFPGKSYAIGNHKYQLRGYKDVVHQTRANW